MTLRRIIGGWLLATAEEDFTNLLSVLRRAFSTFDRSERRKLFDEIAKMPPAAVPAAPGQPALAPAPPPGSDAPGFAAALPLLLTILGAAPGTLQ